MKRTKNMKRGSEPKQIPCPICFGKEFVTEPNAYDIYEIWDFEPQFIRSKLIDQPFRLYCRSCGQELNFKKKAKRAGKR